MNMQTDRYNYKRIPCSKQGLKSLQAKPRKMRACMFESNNGYLYWKLRGDNKNL